MKKMIKGKEDIFKKRNKQKILFIFWFLFFYVFSTFLTGFENGTAFLSIPNGIIWLFKNFIPSEEALKYIPIILKTKLKTLSIGITATMISSIFSLFFSIIGSESLGINKFSKIMVKVVVSIFRNMPLIAWAIILLFSFKQSEMTGLIALVVVTFGYMTRTFMETIDEVAGSVVEALKSTGANYFQIIFQGVIPTVSNQLISWIFYYIENSVREVTLIGMLTGTGIGFLFNMYYRDFKYDVAGLVILMIIVLVMGIEWISNKIRDILAKGNRKSLKKIIGILFLVSIFTLFKINGSDINIKTAIVDFFKNLKWMFLEARLSDRYTYSEIFMSLLVTLSLAVLTTLIGSVIAILLAFLASKNLTNEKFSKGIKLTMSFIRAIPTILWVMVFSVIMSIGVEAAVIGMIFHSVAYLVKAYSESIEEIDKGVIESLKSTGASWWQIIFQGIIPTAINSILSWTFVRFEINFTNAVVVGAASGAGGIGYEMFMAGIMYFDIREIGFFTFLILGITMVLERISILLKGKYLKKV